MGYPVCPANPALYNSSTQEFPLGSWWTYEGELYQHVQFKDAVTYAAKQPLTWDDAKTFAVTNDISSSEDKEMLAGFAMMAHTTAYYGFIKKKGKLTAVPKAAGDDTIVPSTPLVPHLTTDATLMSHDDFSASTAGNPTDAEIVALAQEVSKVCCWAHDTSDDPNDTVDVRFDCP